MKIAPKGGTVLPSVEHRTDENCGLSAGIPGRNKTDDPTFLQARARPSGLWDGLVSVATRKNQSRRSMDGSRGMSIGLIIGEDDLKKATRC
jgi:hypothetical protein